MGGNRWQGGVCMEDNLSPPAAQQPNPQLPVSVSIVFLPTPHHCLHSSFYWPSLCSWGWGDGGFGDHDNVGIWHRGSEKSPAAHQREQQAQDAFTFLLNSQAPVIEAAKSDIIFPLLSPRYHLTPACYASFQKWVKENHGG